MTSPIFRSVRTRLTVWYVAVLAGILILYVAAVFAFQYALLQRQMYHDEVQDVETVEGLLSFTSTGQLELQQSYFVRPKNRLLVDRYMEVRDLQDRFSIGAQPLKARRWEPSNSPAKVPNRSTNEPFNCPTRLASS